MASCSFVKEGRTFKLDVVETSYSVENNTSNVKWTLTISGGGGYWNDSYAKVTVNGSVVYNQTKGWSTGEFPAKDGSVSGTINGIQHDTQGNKTISFSVEGYSFEYTVKSASGSLTLTSIPRYATSNQSLNSKTETTIKMNWSSDSTIDYIWCSINGGSSWIAIGSVNATSGNYNITGLSANTSYSIKTRVRRKDSQLTTDSSATSISTYDYPYCNSSPNFLIGDTLTLGFYNPLGRSISVTLIGNNSTIGTWSTSSTSLSGFTSSSTINSLYASIPNSQSGTYKVQVTYGSSTKTRNNGNTYTQKASDCSPSFSNFNVKDSNNDIVAITGSDQVFVKGYSNLYVTIPSANKMTTQKSATPSSYSLSCDTLNNTANYSTSDVNVSMGVLANSGTLRVNVRAYDSRSNSALAYKDITVYDYSKPVINVSATRLNNFENQTTLQISGTYTRLTINNTDKNTVTTLRYRYRETGGTWGNWTTLTASIVAGSFTCTDVILSLDNTKSFEFQIEATDNLDTTTKTANVDIGQAIFFVSSNNRKCYINGQEILMYDVVDTW